MSALLALRRAVARNASAGAILAVIGLCCGASATAGAAEREADQGRDSNQARVAKGRELFMRDWRPNDPRAHGGDGLGPVFNASSCLACHDLGGVGGAGSREANVKVLSPAGPWTEAKLASTHPGLVEHRRVVLHRSGVDGGYERWRQQRLNLALRSKQKKNPLDEPLETTVADSLATDVWQGIDPSQGAPAAAQFMEAYARQASAYAAMASAGMTSAAAANGVFMNASFVNGAVVNGAGVNGNMFNPIGDSIASSAAEPTPRSRPRRTAPAAESRSTRVVTTMILAASERNTTPLFGLGLINRIPEAAIEAVAADEQSTTPKTAGRISRVDGDRIGRFGWHAQRATLADFTLGACAVEIGLEAPGHPQAGDPRSPDYRSPGFDMDADDCAALVAYVAQLPAPTVAIPADPVKEKLAREGRLLFAKVGCADCHRETVGEVVGLYSDLLLHDMGMNLSAGDYGAFTPSGEPARDASDQPSAAKRLVDYSKPRDDERLWRTAPLWGVASSAPYMHDGRAKTLGDAIKLHAGQGSASAKAYSRLDPTEQDAVLTFLGSQIAPPSAERVFRPFGGWGSMSRMEPIACQRAPQPSAAPLAAQGAEAPGNIIARNPFED